jgi:hypothetical protein
MMMDVSPKSKVSPILTWLPVACNSATTYSFSTVKSKDIHFE